MSITYDSTEYLVQTAYIDAVRGISSSLGFDDETGNLHRELLEMWPLERRASYLQAQVDGRNTARAVGVYVKPGNSQLGETGDGFIYRVRATIEYYTEFGREGEGYGVLTEGIVDIRNAIDALGTSVSNHVTFTERVDIEDARQITLSESKQGVILAQAITLELEK